MRLFGDEKGMKLGWSGGGHGGLVLLRGGLQGEVNGGGVKRETH